MQCNKGFYYQKQCLGGPSRHHFEALGFYGCPGVCRRGNNLCKIDPRVGCETSYCPVWSLPSTLCWDLSERKCRPWVVCRHSIMMQSLVGLHLWRVRGDAVVEVDVEVVLPDVLPDGGNAGGVHHEEVETPYPED